MVSEFTKKSSLDIKAVLPPFRYSIGALTPAKFFFDIPLFYRTEQCAPVSNISKLAFFKCILKTERFKTFCQRSIRSMPYKLSGKTKFSMASCKSIIRFSRKKQEIQFALIQYL